jgi:hypothetical protein
MRRLLNLGLCGALLLSGCAAPAPSSCAAPGRAMLAEHLYMGQDTPQGEVPAAAWQAFLDSEVTPRFPQGFSVWQVSGQWKSTSGTLVHESTQVVNIVHENLPETRTAIAQIVQAYKSRFQQEAVLRVQTWACVSL